MKVILRALQTMPPDFPQAPSSSSSYAGGGKVNPAAAAAAQSTMERVFDHCQQVSLNPGHQLTHVWAVMTGKPYCTPDNRHARRHAGHDLCHCRNACTWSGQQRLQGVYNQKFAPGLAG